MFTLMRLRWSGVGCLGPVLWLPVVLAAVALADGAGGSVPGIAIAMGFVVAAAVVRLLGSWLNGRPPEPRH